MKAEDRLVLSKGACEKGKEKSRKGSYGENTAGKYEAIKRLKERERERERERGQGHSFVLLVL